jgi:hypothetical protein
LIVRIEGRPPLEKYPAHPGTGSLVNPLTLAVIGATIGYNLGAQNRLVWSWAIDLHF